MSAADATLLANALRGQGLWCDTMGAPFYGTLLRHAADDVDAGGPMARLLAGHAQDPPMSALALRVLGAVHRLVLAGEVPALAAHYPSTGGDGDAERAWPVFRAFVAAEHDRLRPLVERGVQTNEIGRTCALAPGFLWIARRTGLPLACLEVGASAGLNLRWDRHRYEADGVAWGDPAAVVAFAGVWREGRPPFDVATRVVERRGCDRAPLDPTNPEDRLTLAAFVWPDQHERRTRLARAFEVAATVPVRVERADAVPWLRRVLADPRPGVATVVYHSIVWQYLADDVRSAFRETLAAAGARATPRAPLAWLRLENADEEADLRCTVWPDGGERRLATAGFHGQWVRWLAD